MCLEEERTTFAGFFKPRLRTELTGQAAVFPLSHLMAQQNKGDEAVLAQVTWRRDAGVFQSPAPYNIHQLISEGHLFSSTALVRPTAALSAPGTQHTAACMAQLSLLLHTALPSKPTDAWRCSGLRVVPQFPHQKNECPPNHLCTAVSIFPKL